MKYLFRHERTQLMTFGGWLVGILTAWSSATAQDQRSADPGAPAGDQELTASEILSRAAEAQGPPLAPDQISLHAQMVLHLRDEQGDDIQVTAERKFQPPHLIWTRLEEEHTGTINTVGFDGTQSWFHSGKDDRVQLLVGADFEPDRKKLRADIDQTQLLMRVFFLANLIPTMSDFERLPDESAFGKTAYRVAAKGSHEEAGRDRPARLELWIEHDSFRLYGARLTYLDGDQESLHLCFWAHERNEEGIVVPREIQIFVPGNESPAQTLYVGKIRFRAPLQAKDFRPPR